jgi:hypothetical protein
METHFAPDARERAERVARLQDDLMVLTDEKAGDVFDAIMDLGWPSEADGVKQLVHTLYTTCSVRPYLICRVVTLISMVLERSPVDCGLKSQLIPSNLPRQRRYRSFLACCLLQKVVTADDFSSFIHGLAVSDARVVRAVH